MDSSRVPVPPHLPDRPEVRDDILNYYCEVQQFDNECGEILDILRARKLLDNTLVIMTSDNGWQMPRGLANCHDLGVRVPLAVHMPGKVRKGHVANEFVKLDDLFPTILEAAGLTPKATPAKSLWPLLNGRSDPARDHMFVERERHANVRRGDLSYPVRGLRTREYLYLRNLAADRYPAGDPELYWAVGPYGDADPSASKTLLTDPARREELSKYFELSFGKRPAEELYDLRHDPGQIDNVASNAEYAKIKALLSKRVDAWMRETGDPRASGWTDFFDKAPYSGARARPTSGQKN